MRYTTNPGKLLSGYQSNARRESDIFFPDTPIKSTNISAFEIENIGMTFVFLKIREYMVERLTFNLLLGSSFLCLFQRFFFSVSNKTKIIYFRLEWRRSNL